MHPGLVPLTLAVAGVCVGLGGALAVASGAVPRHLAGMERHQVRDLHRPPDPKLVNGHGASTNTGTSTFVPVAGERDYPSVQVRFLPVVGQSATVGEQQALAIVRLHAPRRADYVGKVPSDVRLVEFTDTSRGTINADGSVSPYFTGVLAWEVTFAGVPVICAGPGAGCDGAAGVTADSVTVVDATSGKIIEAFDTGHSDLQVH